MKPMTITFTPATLPSISISVSLGCSISSLRQSGQTVEVWLEEGRYRSSHLGQRRSSFWVGFLLLWGICFLQDEHTGNAASQQEA